MALLSQSLVIFRKNVTVKKHPKKVFNTLMEICMPVFYAAFIYFFAGVLVDQDVPEVRYLNASNPAPLDCRCGSECRETIAFAPNGAAELQLMQASLDWMATASNSSDKVHPCQLVGYASYSEMRLALLKDDMALRASTAAAVLLDLETSTYSMLLRALDDVYPPLDVSGPSGLRVQLRDTSGDPHLSQSPWILNGGLFLEWALDRAFADLHAPGASARMAALTGGMVDVAKLPLPAFRSSYGPSSGWLLFVLPMYITYGAMSVGMQTIRTMVVEREKRLLEGMRMMGLTPLANNAGWYLTYFCTQGLGPIATTIICNVSGFIAHSNNLLLLVTLALHTLQTVAIIFAILPLVRSSKSAELTALALMIAPSLALYVANVAAGFPPALFYLSCLVSLSAGPLGISRFISAEIDGEGLTSAADATLPLWGVWALQIFGTLLYACLAWYFDQVIPAPTTTGDRKRWDFCLPASCRCRAAPPAPDDAEAIGTGDAGAAMRGTAAGDATAASDVVARRLKKTFWVGRQPVHAVVDVSLDMKRGEVTGLLGQNGAGKTTAINILCGLTLPTAGTASVLGHDVLHAIDAIRALSGICPQHDLLFDELTVAQHIATYAGIKQLKDRRKAVEQVDTWLERLEMAGKRGAYAEQLSGGQRRKVSLVIALLGSPRFVLLDEPTAGMDPQSRRAVWEFIADAKAGRATLLTTHFMDEADVLCSSVVVVSKGTNAATGSPSELKARYASGYHLVAALKADARAEAAGDSDSNSSSQAQQLLAMARVHVPDATLDDASLEQASLTLPAAASKAFPALFAALDADAAALGVASYGVSLPSMQEAFLKILDAQKGAGGYAEARGGGGDGGDLASRPLLSAPCSSAFRPVRGAVQMGIMLSKMRMEFFADLLNNGLTLAGTLALVVLAFTLGALVSAASSSAADAHRPATITLSPAPFAAVHGAGYPLPYLVRPPAVDPDGGGASPAGVVADALAGHLARTYRYRAAPSYATCAPRDAGRGCTHAALSSNLSVGDGAFAAFALPAAEEGATTTLLYNSSYPHALPAYAALLDAALMESAAGGLRVTAKVGRLPTMDEHGSSASATALTQQTAPMVLVFGMLLIVLSTSTRLAAERFASTKQLLLLSGLDVRCFWAGYLLHDAATFLLVCVAAGAIAGGASGALAPAALPAFILTEVCAMPGILALCYMVTLPFKNSDEASGFLSMSFMLFGLLPTVFATFLTQPAAKLAFTCVMLLAPPNQVISGLQAVLALQRESAQKEALGEPAYAASDYFRLTFETVSYDLSSGSLSRGTALGPALVLLVALGSSCFLCALFWRIEIRRFTAPRAPRRAGLPQESIDARGREDRDVAAERARVASLDGGEAAVVMLGLSKRFLKAKSPVRVAAHSLCGRFGGPTVTAVDDLTLAIPNGSCFALLGPNGAGKTTAINVLAGGLVPSAGEASLGGLHRSAPLTRVFELTGFCPQLKGLWESLTLRQHLQLILRLKGLSGAELRAEVERVEVGYGLSEHAHKRAKKLSGGTQRKLSAAMALSCGTPAVVFVDEPTTGVDVGTRRFIWDRIREAARGRCVVLSTHYMDEADALAQRIGIMAAGRLRVLGSPQHLKSRHGGGYRVELKAANAQSDAGLTALVHSHFAHVKRVASHQGSLVFDVAQGFALASVFADFEAAKSSLGLETFTMSQTSLEDVFLRVAEAHKPGGASRSVRQVASVRPATEGETARAGGGGGSGASASVPEGLECERDTVGDDFVREGWYVDGCCAFWTKVTKQPGSDPPAYTHQPMCCMLEWILPIPCCCLPPTHLTRQPDEPHAERPVDEEGVLLYQAPQATPNKRPEKHVWLEPGKFKRNGKDTFTRRM